MNREEHAHAVRLDAAIDAMLRGEDDGEDDGEAVELAAARSLAGLGDSLPAPGRAPEIRREVLTAFPQHRRYWRWLVLAPAAATLAFSGVAAASRNAAPGDALFPLRRGMQAVRVAVAFGDDAKASALLDRAERDLVDARAFLTHNDKRGVRHALEVFDADIDGARAAISRTDGPARDALDDRADRLEREARTIHDAVDDDRSGSSGEDRSGSGSGEDSSDDRSGDGGGDDSGSGSSGSGSDDGGSSGDGDDGSSGSGGGGDDGGSSGSDGGDDHSGSGSDDHSGPEGGDD